VQKSTFTREYALLCKLLREQRETAGITQVELAERLGETQSYVSKVERGERRLDLVQLGYFCKAIGIHLTDFVARFEKQRNKRVPQ
jgi:transcriptional regulator with XRE-family HTH domain